MVSDLRDLVLDDLRRHPRVAYQGLLTAEQDVERIAATLPPLPYFRKQYVGAFSVIDWDHRLPSERLIWRVFGFYSEDTLAAGYEAYDDRLESIGNVDRYPEFDVPDFDQLAADEAYDVELEPDGSVVATRLTSLWRREIKKKDCKLAIDFVRKSDEFKTIKKLAGRRPPYLGDLEAVSWTPPCESEHLRWTIDVWYLLDFDGRIGIGRSFLVDLDENKLIANREFQVRAG